MSDPTQRSALERLRSHGLITEQEARYALAWRALRDRAQNRPSPAVCVLYSRIQGTLANVSLKVFGVTEAVAGMDVLTAALGARCSGPAGMGVYDESEADRDLLIRGLHIIGWVLSVTDWPLDDVESPFARGEPIEERLEAAIA